MFGPQPSCAGGLASFAGEEGWGHTAGQTKSVTESPSCVKVFFWELMFLDSNDLGITEIVVMLIG
jgi:hypothetical protein